MRRALRVKKSPGSATWARASCASARSPRARSASRRHSLRAAATAGLWEADGSPPMAGRTPRAASTASTSTDRRIETSRGLKAVLISVGRDPETLRGCFLQGWEAVLLAADGPLEHGRRLVQLEPAISRVACAPGTDLVH